MDNKKSTSRNYIEALKWCGGILILMLLYASILVLFDLTIVDWWRPVAVAALAALISWSTMRRWWKRIWRNTSVWILLLAHIVIAGGVALLLILGLNAWCADDTTLHSEQVTVTERIRETHHHTQRAGRRHYRQGSPYYKYYLMVEFSDGRQKKMEVSMNRYNHTRTGAEITLNLKKGLFGYPVISR